MGRILIALLCASVVSCTAGRSEAAAVLLREHNDLRATRGLRALVLDEGLCEYAQSHADKMARDGRLAHSSMRSLMNAAGAAGVAENIAWGQNSEAEVCRAWVSSPGHKSNMLGRGYTKVGFGVKEDQSGRKYWCAVFSE